MTQKFRFWCLRAGNCLAAMTIFLNAGLRANAEDVPPYLRSNLPIDTRVRDLLSRMTLDEKIGQMVQADLGALADAADVQTYALGSMLSGGNSKPPANNPGAPPPPLRDGNLSGLSAGDYSSQRLGKSNVLPLVNAIRARRITNLCHRRGRSCSGKGLLRRD